MLPRRIDHRDALPLTANGKLDRARLTLELERPAARVQVDAPDGSLRTQRPTAPTTRLQ